MLSGCLAIGVASGINPTYGLAAALGLGFTVAVLVDLALGLTLFTALSFLEVLAVGGGAASFMKVAGLLVFLSWLARTSTQSRTTASSFADAHPAMTTWMIGLIAWCAISAAWAASSGVALTNAYRYALDALLVPIVFTGVQNRKHVHLVVGAFILGAVYSTAYGLIHPPAPNAAAAGRLVGGLGDANEQACVIVAALALSIGMIGVIRRSPALKLAMTAGIVIALIGLVSTESRGGLVSFGCVLLGAVIFGGRWRRRAAVVLVVALVGTGVYLVAGAGGQGSRVTSTNSSGRNDLWKVGWRMFSAHPVFGVGAGNFPLVSIQYEQRPGTITSAIYIVDTPKVAHNIYLEQLADLGIPGLIVMLGVFGGALAAALKAARAFERSGDVEMELLARCLILALVGFLSADFFLSNLVSKQLWIVIALCPAILKLARAGAMTAQT